MKKRILFLLLFINILKGTFAKTINDTQIILPDSEIYRLFMNLQITDKQLVFTSNTPLSVGELKFYLKSFEYEKLTNEQKVIFDNINSYLYEKDNLLNTQNLQVSVHPKINLEAYYKTNENVPWNFNYNFVDPLIRMPILIGFGNEFSIVSDMFFGKNYIAAVDNNNKSNIPFRFDDIDFARDMEFYFPFYAYGSVGKYYDDYGFNINIGKKGKSIGQTISGSILYNKTFESDAYIEFDAYSDYVKYTFDIVHISSNRMDNIQMDNTDRIMYMHEIDVKIFKNLKLSVFEGSLTANPFSIRFMNPLVFMHQFGGWTDYATNENQDIYKETNFCADFALMFEYIPIRNLRLYGIFNQIELQLSYEREQSWGRYYPNSIGLQAGADYTILFSDLSNINFGLESFYNSPYMYIKQTPSASLYKVRADMNRKEDVYSWIGSPYGPDCFGSEFVIKYNSSKNYSLEFDYLFLMKGEKDFNIFNQIVTVDGKQYYSYYPSVLYRLINKKKISSDLSNDDIYNDATNLWVSGIPMIKNQFRIKGSYNITDSFTLNGQFVYNYIINNKNIKNTNENCFEIDLSVSYSFY